MMIGVTITDAGPVFDNASTGSSWITPLSWLLQVMPLFFVIGGFAGALAYRRLRERGGTAASFVTARLHRLLLPAMIAIRIVGAALALLALAGIPDEFIAIAGYRYSQPLWFLGVFLLCQALLPALWLVHERAPLRTIVALTTAALLVDVIRTASGIDAVGLLNLAFVWLTLQQLGFFLADGSIGALRRRVRGIVGLGAAAILALACAYGAYSPDLIANLNPPTTALVLVGIAHTCALSLVRDRLESFSHRRFAAAFARFVNRRTMTIYLWHMPVLLAMAGGSAVFALATDNTLPAPSTLEWWFGRPLWILIAFGITAMVAMLLAPIESQRLSPVTPTSQRSALAAFCGLVAVVTLLVFGTSVLTAAIAVALIVLASPSRADHDPPSSHDAGFSSSAPQPHDPGVDQG